MRRSRLSALLAGILLLAGAACSEAPLGGGPDDRHNVVDLDIGELRQRVEISNVTPQRGEKVLITSTVLNRGAPREVESRICGLDISLLEPGPGAKCMGWSMRARLGTGESLAAAEERIVNLPPGTHDIRVRHLLDPESWVVVRIVVRL